MEEPTTDLISFKTSNPGSHVNVVIDSDPNNNFPMYTIWIYNLSAIMYADGFKEGVGSAEVLLLMNDNIVGTLGIAGWVVDE